MENRKVFVNCSDAEEPEETNPVFWFGKEDSEHVLRIMMQYMKHFKLTRFKNPSSRAPHEFIGCIRRTQLQSSQRSGLSSSISCCDSFLFETAPSSSAEPSSPKVSKGRRSRVKTLDCVSIYQRDDAPLGFQMTLIRQEWCVTRWDSADGLPLRHQPVESQEEYDLLRESAAEERPIGLLFCSPDFACEDSYSYRSELLYSTSSVSITQPSSTACSPSVPHSSASLSQSQPKPHQHQHQHLDSPYLYLLDATPPPIISYAGPLSRCIHDTFVLCGRDFAVKPGGLDPAEEELFKNPNSPSTTASNPSIPSDSPGLKRSDTPKPLSVSTRDCPSASSAASLSVAVPSTSPTITSAASSFSSSSSSSSSMCSPAMTLPTPCLTSPLPLATATARAPPSVPLPVTEADPGPWSGCSWQGAALQNTIAHRHHQEEPEPEQQQHGLAAATEEHQHHARSYPSPTPTPNLLEGNQHDERDDDDDDDDEDSRTISRSEARQADADADDSSDSEASSSDSDSDSGSDSDSDSGSDSDSDSDSDSSSDEEEEEGGEEEDATPSPPPSTVNVKRKQPDLKESTKPSVPVDRFSSIRRSESVPCSLPRPLPPRAISISSSGTIRRTGTGTGTGLGFSPGSFSPDERDLANSPSLQMELDARLSRLMGGGVSLSIGSTTKAARTVMGFKISAAAATASSSRR